MVFPNNGIARLLYIGGKKDSKMGSHDGLKKILCKDPRIPYKGTEEYIKCAETMIILSCKYRENKVSEFTDAKTNQTK